MEKALRREEQKADTIHTCCRKLLRVARRYPSLESLIPSMAKRVREASDEARGRHAKVLKGKARTPEDGLATS